MVKLTEKEYTLLDNWNTSGAAGLAWNKIKDQVKPEWRPEDWRPKVPFPGLGNRLSGTNDESNAIFRWNIRQLEIELNGDWRWDWNRDGRMLVNWLTWGEGDGFDFSFRHSTLSGIGPWRDGEATAKAQAILNAALTTWANPEKWMR